ncbi:MAG: hypothetical protein HGGPFJEG_01349 [Ignavibacteria bacterium]|nr:hypothetical protein [Ignavibacteria bacterium]
MNFKLWLLTLFGVVMGFAAVFGLTQKNELYYWLIIGVVTAFAISKITKEKIFIKSTVIGLFIGVFNGIIQFAMFNTYMENNPDTLDGFSKIPLSLAPQYVLLFAAPFSGLVFGMFTGLIALIFIKVTEKKHPDI